MSYNWREMLKSIKFEGRPFICGTYMDDDANTSITKKSPINGIDLPPFFLCTPRHVDLAVTSAKKAYEKKYWRGLSPAARKQILFNFAHLIRKYGNILAATDCLSMGKPVSECLTNDILHAEACLCWYAEALDKVYGKSVAYSSAVTALVLREPIGVVGAITPWNFPMENIAWKLGPALAAGNSVVLKPSEEATFSALLVGQLANEAGIPPGVLNIIPGDGKITGRALALHKDVDALFFTGSSFTGGKILEYAGQSNLKRIGLECGGKSAFILLDDYSDIKHAVKTLADNFFYNQGQICSAPSRVIVDRKIKKQFLSYLLDILDDYMPGDPLEDKTHFGAVVSHKHLNRILAVIEDAKKEGATLAAGGDRVFPVSDGAYIAPTVFDNVLPQMRIARNEIFGPVLCVIEADGWSDAILKANDTSYGLAASIWTENINIAHQAFRELHAGTIHINSYGEDDLSVPFGGFKLSGNGSKDKSLHAIDDYSEFKTVWFKQTKLGK